MKIIAQILMEAGPLAPGFHLRIDNEPWMALHIEDIGLNGPNGLPAISVAHYSEQNGNLMRDPEMLFEVIRNNGEIELSAYYWRQDYLGIEQYSCRRDADGRPYVVLELKKHHDIFARTWNRNLREQGFLEAFRQSRKG